MRYAPLYDGALIPRLGLGTWKMGGDSSPDYSQDERILDALRTALDLGYRHFDTSEMYGGGHTEELIGQAIRGYKRQELFITTKVWPSNLHYRGVLKAIEGSLQRLGIEYVDLYLIHWPNPQIPLADTFKAMNELADQGLARYVGVSNFDLRLLEQSQIHSKYPIAANQVPYSLYQRTYRQNEVLEFCQENKIILIGYSPIGKGSVVADRRIGAIADRYQATPAQVALAWLIQQPQVVAIPKATSREHLEENLGALEVKLTEEDVEVLNRLS
ncbi:MAG: aldo/keto reductase [Chloroflexota bacterium]|nr:MAG: aldo/keto reductase [Chloroflexota bacterium]